ncbi:MAG: hypothetical protein LBK29_04055 [Oscillospiraceae bacterium]|jgi:hypothetical protein|nr:hypothetical protein [Oscillospiraceae bacterium]
MLKNGQIKFSWKALSIVRPYFIKKKVNEFLVVIKPGEIKPSGLKDIYRQLVGEKQNPANKNMVYANNLEKAKKFFSHLLLKEGRLSLIASPAYNCVLYISKEQQNKYNRIKSPDFDWPAAFLNENESTCVAEYERKMNKTTAIDLSELISELQ